MAPIQDFICHHHPTRAKIEGQQDMDITTLFLTFTDNYCGTDGILEKNSKHHDVTHLWAEWGRSVR